MAEKEKLMFNDTELNLIKATFCENEELLKTMRKLFFGVELSQEAKDGLRATFANKELVEAVRHKTYGTNNFDTPIGQLSDFWIGVESQIFGASRDTIFQSIESKKLVFEMFTKAFNLLSNPDGEKVDISSDLDLNADPLGVKMIARNLYMKAIDGSLMSLLQIGGKKGETIDETLKRLQRDSTK